MGDRILTGDPARTVTEYAVALPDGTVVTDAYKLPGSVRHNAYGRESARGLADLYNEHYRKVGAPAGAVAVSRVVVTTYSDWTEIGGDGRE